MYSVVEHLTYEGMLIASGASLKYLMSMSGYFSGGRPVVQTSQSLLISFHPRFSLKRFRESIHKRSTPWQAEYGNSEVTK